MKENSNLHEGLTVNKQLGSENGSLKGGGMMAKQKQRREAKATHLLARTSQLETDAAVRQQERS